MKLAKAEAALRSCASELQPCCQHSGCFGLICAAPVAPSLALVLSYGGRMCQTKEWGAWLRVVSCKHQAPVLRMLKMLIQPIHLPQCLYKEAGKQSARYPAQVHGKAAGSPPCAHSTKQEDHSAIVNSHTVLLYVKPGYEICCRSAGW